MLVSCYVFLLVFMIVAVFLCGGGSGDYLLITFTPSFGLNEGIVVELVMVSCLCVGLAISSC